MRENTRVIEPWICSKCGAAVFVPQHVHAYLCNEYQGNKILVAGSLEALEAHRKNYPVWLIGQKRFSTVRADPLESLFIKLKEAYSNGHKLKVIVCPKCQWVRGFFFYRNGQLGFDPGCWCNGNLKPCSSKAEHVFRLMRKKPGWAEERLLEAQNERRNHETENEQISAVSA